MAAYISSSYTFRRQRKLHRVLPLDQRIELARSVFLRHTSAQAACTQTSGAVTGTRVSSAGRNGISTFSNRRRGTITTLQRRCGRFSDVSVADVGLRLGLSAVRTLRLVWMEGALPRCWVVLLSTSCKAGSDEPRDTERASCLLGALVGPWLSYGATTSPPGD